MAEELGKIEKLDVEKFGDRKLYVVPLMFSGQDAPDDYKEKLEEYWRQVNEQIANQEVKVGKIKRIYFESMSTGGEEGLKAMELLNSSSNLIIKDKLDCGAVCEATELAELSNESMDWERCIYMGFFSKKAAETVIDLYQKVTRQRYDYIGQRIDETLQKGESGILFIREGHMIQFANDIEVFSVAPPALDEIHRWLRDNSNQPEEENSPEGP